MRSSKVSRRSAPFRESWCAEDVRIRGAPFGGLGRSRARTLPSSVLRVVSRDRRAMRAALSLGADVRPGVFGAVAGLAVRAGGARGRGTLRAPSGEGARVRAFGMYRLCGRRDGGACVLQGPRRLERRSQRAGSGVCGHAGRILPCHPRKEPSHLRGRRDGHGRHRSHRGRCARSGRRSGRRGARSRCGGQPLRRADGRAVRVPSRRLLGGRPADGGRPSGQVRVRDGRRDGLRGRPGIGQL